MLDIENVCECECFHYLMTYQQKHFNQAGKNGFRILSLEWIVAVVARLCELPPGSCPIRIAPGRVLDTNLNRAETQPRQTKLIFQRPSGRNLTFPQRSLLQ